MLTSSQDATSEAIVLNNLKRSSSSSNRTTIIIAHRLATVRDADRIVVMKDGQVVQDGQHESLLKSNGLYAELIQAQQFDKKRESSTTSSIKSSPQSSYKEHDHAATSNDDTVSHQSLVQAHQPKKSATQLITRCLSLSRSEVPAIIVGLLSSVASGGVIIGEVCLHSVVGVQHY
jgi:ATP-binding cassette subfamily B (MDR/TAP) protein 1